MRLDFVFQDFSFQLDVAPLNVFKHLHTLDLNFYDNHRFFLSLDWNSCVWQQKLGVISFLGSLCRWLSVVSNSMLPAAIMWKIQGSLCSPTEFRLQHISVPYSNVRVGVKVRRLVEPLVRIKRLLTVLASAELLKVHLPKNIPLVHWDTCSITYSYGPSLTYGY